MLPKRATTRRRHRQRKGDPPFSTGQKLAFGTVAGATCIGFAAFLWQMIEILERHSDWAFVNEPPGWSEILAAVFYATVAFAGALFSDFRKLFKLITGKGPS